MASEIGGVAGVGVNEKFVIVHFTISNNSFQRMGLQIILWVALQIHSKFAYVPEIIPILHHLSCVITSPQRGEMCIAYNAALRVTACRIGTRNREDKCTLSINI